MLTLYCDHRGSSSRLPADSSPITIYPNFIYVNDQNIYTHDSLHFGQYVYLGGDSAVERGIIDKYIAQIVHHDISMIGNAASINQEAFNRGLSQLAPVNRRFLTTIIQAFLVLQLEMSFGYSHISTPSQLTEFSQWSWDRFPRLLSCFIYLWTNHRSTIGSCGEHCSKCLIIDGHQKSRRRICAFKDVKVDTEEMKNMTI